jgi:hypothetical protein
MRKTMASKRMGSRERQIVKERKARKPTIRQPDRKRKRLRRQDSVGWA